jgi:crossover junction endodeoxyribonuclease RuvC
LSARILGVDPGLTRCGIGVVEQGSGRNVTLVHAETVKSDADLALAERIRLIGDHIEKVILQYQPQTIALERVFAQANLRTVMGTAQISGVVLLLSARHGIPISLHTPSEVKAAVTGNGRADKLQVGKMVAAILKLTEIPKPADSADALAIAITHAWRMGVAAGAETGSAATSTTKAQESWRAAIEASKKR